MDKQKVKLAYNAFSWPVRNALIYYSEISPNFFPPNEVKATVEFIDASRDFFDILNINHVKKGPIKSFESKKVHRLLNIGTYFHSISHSGILSHETFTALQQTISASILVIKMLLSNKPNSMVFTAFFQQDPIEEHFGHQRNHAGCAYRVTPLQFTQTERKLTNLSNLKSATQCNTKREKQPVLNWNEDPIALLADCQSDKFLTLCNVEALKDHDYTKPPELFQENDENVSQDTELVQMDPSTESTLVYIRGGIMRKILNHSNCSSCVDVLIQNTIERNTSSYLIQMDFCGNSLLQPSKKFMSFFHILYVNRVIHFIKM